MTLVHAINETRNFLSGTGILSHENLRLILAAAEQAAEGTAGVVEGTFEGDPAMAEPGHPVETLVGRGAVYRDGAWRLYDGAHRAYDSRGFMASGDRAAAVAWCLHGQLP